MPVVQFWICVLIGNRNFMDLFMSKYRLRYKNKAIQYNTVGATCRKGQNGYTKNMTTHCPGLAKALNK